MALAHDKSLVNEISHLQVEVNETQPWFIFFDLDIIFKFRMKSTFIVNGFNSGVSVVRLV